MREDELERKSSIGRTMREEAEYYKLKCQACRALRAERAREARGEPRGNVKGGRVKGRADAIMGRGVGCHADAQ